MYASFLVFNDNTAPSHIEDAAAWSKMSYNQVKSFKISFTIFSLHLNQSKVIKLPKNIPHAVWLRKKIP